MDQKQAIADRLKQANNILVTVSNNPSVDQLASCIGLTLALNKMGKHATAVFSGTVPSTIEFLQPEKTIEKNTDSLRDFIIALDKAKADKLRYKVEDKVVKIFITPYKTSISEKDLDFSQGDFNVDVVLALGVHQQTELDQAITSHGRILHDAVVATVNTKPGGELGTMNWLDTTASSLSELVTQLLDGIDPKLIDGQMATALLTGIVAETNRFSNEKTTPTTMSISAVLMGAGANQQLVATKLEEPAPMPVATSAPAVQGDQGAKLQTEQSETHTEDGTLEIAHAASEEESKTAEPAPPSPAPAPMEEHEPEPPTPQIHIDEEGALHSLDHADKPIHGTIDPTQHMSTSHMILQPPVMSGEMNASAVPEDRAAGDPLQLPQPDEPGFGPTVGGGGMFGPPPASANITPPTMPYLPPSMTPGAPAPALPADEPAGVPGPAAPPSHVVTPTAMPASPPPPPPMPAPNPLPPLPPLPPATPPMAPAAPPMPAPTPVVPPTPPAPQGETLSQIEADVNSPHLQPAAAPSVPDMPPMPMAPPMSAAPTMPPLPPATPPMPASATAPAPAPEPPAQESPDLDKARADVMQAFAGEQGPQAPPEPIMALNAQPLGAPLHEQDLAAGGAPAPAPVNLDATANPTFTLPDAPVANAAPPAVPPPMTPPANFGQ